jgi:PKD domain
VRPSPLRTLRGAAVAVVVVVFLALSALLLADSPPAHAALCTGESSYTNVQALGTVTTFSIGASGDASVSGTVHWGDGADTQVTAVGQEIEHEWKAPGTYRITFDGSGQLGDEPCASAGQFLGEITVLAPLKAKIEYHAGKTGATLDGTGSTPADQISSYSWTFDDGKAAQGAMVTHPFKKGRHLVSLEILDGHGQHAVADRTIFVGVEPKSGSAKGSNGSDAGESAASKRSGSGSGGSGSGGSSKDSGSDASPRHNGTEGADGGSSDDRTDTTAVRRGGASPKRRFCLAANDFADIIGPLMSRGEPVAALDSTFVTRYENDRKQMQTLASATLKQTVADAFLATDLLLGGTKPTAAQFATAATALDRLADYCS